MVLPILQELILLLMVGGHHGNSSETVLVVAAHPDDEVLGWAELLHDMLMKVTRSRS